MQRSKQAHNHALKMKELYTHKINACIEESKIYTEKDKSKDIKKYIENTSIQVVDIDSVGAKKLLKTLLSLLTNRAIPLL